MLKINNKYQPPIYLNQTIPNYKILSNVFFQLLPISTFLP
jgi:hypothetical protein